MLNSNKSGLRFFTDEEFLGRIEKVRSKMAEAELDACIITNPENVYYLTGLHHQGYFAYSSLILPLEKEPLFISRAMEKAIVRDMLLPGIRHMAYSDGVPAIPPPQDRKKDLTMGVPTDTGSVAGVAPWAMSVGVSVEGNRKDPLDYSGPAGVTCEALEALKLSQSRVAFEKSSSFLPYKVAEAIVNRMDSIQWSDAENLVNDCRVIQSPAELRCTRRAAEISDAMLMGGVAAAGPGQSENDVMATIYQIMLQRGSTYPAYVPLVRSTRTLDHEHGTWEDLRLGEEDMLFMEFSGCVWRYHAPIGRLAHIGRVSTGARKTHQVSLDALLAAADAIRPGVTADSVYQAWQNCVNNAGLSHYRRHHCGYIVGIGFPPCWSGSGVPRSLRNGSQMEIKQGMVFLLMSWLLRTGEGDAFLCDTIEVTEKGSEFLTKSHRDLILR